MLADDVNSVAHTDSYINNNNNNTMTDDNTYCGNGNENHDISLHDRNRPLATAEDLANIKHSVGTIIRLYACGFPLFPLFSS